MTPEFDVWIDRGGTFTDCVARRRSTGEVSVIKVLSGDDAPVRAIRQVARLGPADPLPSCAVRVGTTLATNALLERTGSPVGVLLPEGLGDLLGIDDQSRGDLFDLAAGRAAPLTDRVATLRARVGADGSVIRPVDPAEVERALEALVEAGAETVVVALLHAPRFPAHEREVAAIARARGLFVVCSHEVSAEPGLLARTQTAVVDAYLTPLLRRHLARLERAVGSSLELLTSAGQLVAHDQLRGRDAVLSGPAGGAVACQRIAAQIGAREVLGFDMGGTSTDVCRVSEAGVERRGAAVLGGVRVRAPMVAVHTVAAGGGSICRFDGQRLAVGPESAGSEPGPLAYGRPDAAEPTLTDVAVVLGRIPSDRFPFPLDEARARAGVAALAARAGMAPDACARGLFSIAVEHMAGAIAAISTARGHDPRSHVLVLFGGAAGQWGGAVARRLGIRRLVVHPLAGVLSAFGIGVSARGFFGERACFGALDAALLQDAALRVDELVEEGARAVGAVAETRPTLAVRYVGGEATLDVPLDLDPSVVSARFEETHRRRFGYVRAGRPLEAVRVRVEVASASPAVTLPSAIPGTGAPRGRTTLEGREVDLWWREDLPIASPLAGPFVVLEQTGTLVVDEGFVVTRRPDDLLVLDDVGAQGKNHKAEPSPPALPDPVRLEVFAHAFTSIAERMGLVLQRTALSTNVRDRLDFSCAVFDREGALVANAPHIPVHLGAMGAAVRAVAAAWPAMAPGDVFATNDPSAGGSHLPDVTVVAPVHEASGAICAYVAARGHHADVGGTLPGSMPPSARTLEEEGVVLRAVPVVREGRLEVDALRAAFGAGPWPARRVEENLADLEAQVAACRTGARGFEELVARHGAAQVEAYMGHLQDAAARAVEEAVARLPVDSVEHEDALDDGTVLRVRVAREGARLLLDFTGTAAAHPGNLNAPRAVTVACVLYVLRCLVGRDLPLNEGCLRAVSLWIPRGSLLDPPAGRAVAGGNVETSQRVVDVLLGAFAKLGARVPAASQGTMNNLTLGDETFGYYETLGGGAGALEGRDGTSGVHTHMTNSRITDPEVLEMRAPVRVRRFEIRRGSGGAGRWRGGDGLVRELEVTRPLEVALLAQRRTRRPPGLLGGAPGAAGRDVVIRANGVTEPLLLHATLAAGDAVRIETPGGGGFGEGGER